MKIIKSQRLFSVPGTVRAGTLAGVCCGLVALSSPASVQAQEAADDVTEQIENRLNPENAAERQSAGSNGEGSADAQFQQRVEDALNGRPSPPDVRDDQQDRQDFGQPYYRDAQGRFFFLDPQGGRVYVEQRQQMQTEWRAMRPQPPRERRAPQGPELGVIITPSPEGIRVGQVQSESVAAEAGIQPGDILQQFNGQQLNNPRQLQRLVQSMSAGESAELTVVRNGEEQTVTATFAEATESPRYGAAKPAMDGAKLQQEVQQLRSEVEALRRQMNRLHGQAEDASEDSQPPQPSEGTADPETTGSEEAAPETEAATESAEARLNATLSEEEAEAVRARSSEKVDLSTDEDKSDADAEVETDIEAEAETSDIEPLGDI